MNNVRDMHFLEDWNICRAEDVSKCVFAEDCSAIWELYRPQMVVGYEKNGIVLWLSILQAGNELE